MTDKVRAVLYDDEIMQGLFKAGFISATAFQYRDIYLWVITQVQVRKISKHKAMIEASYKWKLHYNTIDKAVNKFKSATK
jgi:hypothetical protein